MRQFTVILFVGTTLYAQVPPSARDQALGREMARDIERRERFVDDPQVVDYVAGIARKLVATCRGTNAGVRVIDSDTINASVVPDGELFVSTGLLRFVDNESELAGVLAHLMRRSPVQASAGAAASTPQAFITGPNGDSFLPTPETIIPRAAERLVDDAVSVADQRAMQCMDAAGYDPVGMIMVLARLPKIPVERMERVAETIMALEPSSAFLLNTTKFIELRRHIASTQTTKRAPSRN